MVNEEPKEKTVLSLHIRPFKKGIGNSVVVQFENSRQGEKAVRID